MFMIDYWFCCDDLFIVCMFVDEDCLIVVLFGTLVPRNLLSFFKLVVV